MEPNSLWFIRVQCILHDSGVLFSEPLNFYKLKSVYLISGGNQFCRKSELFGPLFCSWILKVLWSQNCWSLVRFQCSVHDSGVLFSESWNFLKLKRGDLISCWNQFCRKSEIFGPPFCISILKVLWSQNSSSLVRFQCILHDAGVLFSESWNFYKLKRGNLISWRHRFRRKSELLGYHRFYFNFKRFMDPNSASSLPPPKSQIFIIIFHP